MIGTLRLEEALYRRNGNVPIFAPANGLGRGSMTEGKRGNLGTLRYYEIGRSNLKTRT